MRKIQACRRILGAVFHDWPRYLRCLLRNRGWIFMRNRNDVLLVSPSGDGVACDWEYTRTLHLCDVFPRTGSWLLQRALRQYPIRFQDAPWQISADSVCWNGAFVDAYGQVPQVSFLIGHRGLERLPLLQLVLQSIAAQDGIRFECIVVEQSECAQIQGQLPSWVRYYHQPVEEGGAYNRSSTFNQAARMARSPLLICHDNDMLIPACYGHDMVSLFGQGYEVINLKRFVFYLDQTSTDSFLSNHDRHALVPESVVENAEGGGSVAISRQAFESIGGFDEAFVGWGGEDLEFWDRCRTLKVWDYANLPVIHLWHAPQPGKRAVRGLGSQTAELTERRLSMDPHLRIDELRRRVLDCRTTDKIL